MVFLVTACGRQRPETVWLFDDDELTMLNGNVKEIAIGNDAPSTNLFYRAYFDRQGNLLRSERRTAITSGFLRAFNITRDTTKMEYSILNDENGKNIAIVGKSLGDNHFTSKWKFDGQDRLSSYVRDVNDSLSITGSYKFDSAGILIEHKLIFPSSAKPVLYKYKYDRSNRLVESMSFEKINGKDSCIAKQTIKYNSFDSHQNWTRMIKYIQQNTTLIKYWYNDTVTREITYY